MARELRQHQALAIQSLRQSLGKGHKRTILQAPTGFGKTVVAGAIVQSALAKGKRVMFVVPAISLVDQAVESFMHEGITDIGVIQAQHELTNYSARVQVASVQTLMRRKIPHADLVIVDECHRWFEFYETWFAQWNNIPFVGLSATPWTKGLGKHYEDLIISATTRDLIDAGFLSKFRVYAPAHPDLSGVRTVAGDYHEGDLSDAMDKPPLIADVVTTWKKLGDNRPTLCFAVDRAHAKHLQQEFLAAGVPAGYVDAYTERPEREQIKRDLHSGAIRVVCNVGVLTTGIDWDVRCIVLARPTKSEILFTQIIGRGLRTADGKDDCIILDHSDTHTRLGFVTDIYHESLDDGKPKSKSEAKPKEQLPKECPACHYLKAPKVHQCPACGFKPEKVSSIEVEAGELEELTGKQSASAKRNRQMTNEQKQHWFNMLRKHAADRGYSEGWSAHKYKEYFSVWPNAREKGFAPPTPEFTSWLRSLNIRNAKRRAA